MDLLSALLCGYTEHKSYQSAISTGKDTKAKKNLLDELSSGKDEDDDDEEVNTSREVHSCFLYSITTNSTM